MGVQTTADKRVDDMRKHLQAAIDEAKRLMLDDSIWGYEEYNEGYFDEAYFALKKAQEVVHKRRYCD